MLAEYGGTPTYAEAEDMKGLSFSVYGGVFELYRSTIKLPILMRPRSWSRNGPWYIAWRGCIGETDFRMQSRGTLLQFLFHMAHNPRVLLKAQEEMDRVVGSGRLPDFSDRESLPYLDAVLEEVYR